MVKAFNFSRLPLIFFGPGKLKHLPGLIKSHGKNIILVTAGDSFVNSAYYQPLTLAFDENGIKFHQITVAKEPSPEIVDEVVGRFRNMAIDAVVSTGGGSVIDAGKAISAMMSADESVMQYLEGVGTREHPGSKLPFIAVPTTAGTGSEATKNAVISNVGKDGFKKSLRHDNFVPDIALIDPELTLSCPRDITAASGMDCFTQLTEAFMSDKANAFTDALAWEGLKAVSESLVSCVEDGSRIESRSGMSFAALTSGICLANAGLGVVHGFASSAGGMFNIPHGVLCGTLMAKANEVNVRELRKKNKNPAALRKYASLGKLFLDNSSGTDDYFIDGFIRFLSDLTDRFNIPRLAGYGITGLDIGSICRRTDIKNNPVKLEQEDLEEILVNRL
jgi:alcohol dehydrogenase class IV